VILKNFQTKAVSDLIHKSQKLLKLSGNRKLIFRSPTGSGKTIMMAEYIERFVLDKISSDDFCFIWATPRKTLTLQSKNKLEKYFQYRKLLKCSEFHELQDNKILTNEVLFLNWESINKSNKNTIIRDNERDFYLQKILENTRDENREVILIIDESHHHATSEISKNLISEFSAKISVEVSATPTIMNPDEIINVDIEDVKLEALIKKSVKLNEGLENIYENERIKIKLKDGTENFILNEAINKRNVLLDSYKKENKKINPLLLIQLPDRKTGEEDRLKTEIEVFLKKKHNISIDNGKLAIYLSEDKQNLENISKNDNAVEVLIFKQAIALGWDCPRAQILVLFRDWKNLSFSIQTIGRIMRMPDAISGYYQNDELNHSYVFTNLDYIELSEDYAKNYLTIYNSKSTKDISLPSYHKKRAREKTRLSPKFTDIFLNIAVKNNLKSILKIKNQKATAEIITEIISTDTDSLLTQVFKKEKFNISNPEDLQRIFDYFVRNNLSPFFPEDISISRVKESIYTFFEQELDLNYEDSLDEILNICLSEKNIIQLKNFIELSKLKYLSETKNIAEEIILNEGWNFPKNISFTGNYSLFDKKKSVMRPFYSNSSWKTEVEFINFVENLDNVEYWFKNGDRDQTFFSIPYTDEGSEKLFYVDFIIIFKNKKIGLFDTKSGFTIKSSKEKSDGLQKYIKRNNKLNLVGGIVTNTNNKTYKGSWVYFLQESGKMKSDDLNNWDLFPTN
jgi:type III restriction enzyme